MGIYNRIKTIGGSITNKIYLIYKAGNLRFLAVTRTYSLKKYGINLIGYFTTVSGVAEVGRFFAIHLMKSEIPFSIYNIDVASYKKLDESSLKSYLPFISGNTFYHKNIYFINADAINGIKQYYPKLFIGRYNAAVFFWEFDDYFEFPEAFKVINEVIAFTDFIATAVRKAAPPHIKVTKFDFPFIKNWEIIKSPEKVRNELGLAKEDFVFIFNFDFFSVYERKNPEAILKAFEKAFAVTDRVKLVLKTMHAEESSDNFKRFQAVVQDMQLKDNIIMINESMERNEFMSVINACDAYISLHRSEGLGLGMLEAMSMQKPVIATRYGGNMDFMNDENSLLVDYTLVPVGSNAAPYKEGWLWADADINQAAVYMSRLYKNKQFAKDLGERGCSYINQHYNQEKFMNNLSSWMKG